MPKEVQDYFNHMKTNMIKDSLTKMIEHCRRTERKYQEGRGSKSGVEFLNLMLQQGCLKMELYIKLLPIIQDYDTPYTLTLQE